MWVRIRAALCVGLVGALAVLPACTSDAEHPARSTGSSVVATGGAFPTPVARLLPDTVQLRLQTILQEMLVLHAADPGAGARGVSAAIVSDHGFWSGVAGTDGTGLLSRSPR